MRVNFNKAPLLLNTQYLHVGMRIVIHCEDIMIVLWFWVHWKGPWHCTVQNPVSCFPVRKQIKILQDHTQWSSFHSFSYSVVMFLLIFVRKTIRMNDMQPIRLEIMGTLVLKPFFLDQKLWWSDTSRQGDFIHQRVTRSSFWLTS